MAILTRWLAPAALAVGLGFGALTPAPAQAQDTLTRVLVDIADVVLRGGQPYYRHGNYGQHDRLYVQRDRYGRPVYYRVVPPRQSHYGPPYGNAYGYYNNRYDNRYDRYDTRYDNRYYDTRYQPPAQRVTCSRSGNCTVKYYDPRYDRRGSQVRYDTRPRYWDGRRWH